MLATALDWIRRTWGVASGAPWWHWLWYAVVLPPSQRPQGWPLLRRLGRAIAWMLRMVGAAFLVVFWPVRVLMHK